MSSFLCFKDAGLANTRQQEWVGSFPQRGQGLKKCRIVNTGEITEQSIKVSPHPNLVLLKAVWEKPFCAFKCTNVLPSRSWSWWGGGLAVLGLDKYQLNSGVPAMIHLDRWHLCSPRMQVQFLAWHSELKEPALPQLQLRLQLWLDCIGHRGVTKEKKK